MIRDILNNLAENISEDSSAYEGHKVTEAEVEITQYLLKLLDSQDIATLHQGLVSRLHELKAKQPK